MAYRNPASLAPNVAPAETPSTRFGSARRRRLAARFASPALSAGSPDHTFATYEPAQDILLSILRSAADLLGAEQGFFLVSRGDTVLEIACTRRMRPASVMEAVLGRAAAPVQHALRQRTAACADAHGRALPMLDGFFESNSPAILCLPLDLGLRDSGVLCLMRRQPGRVNELDWEILQALTDQASLAIGAASHQTALSQLEQSLCSVFPATV